MFSHGRFSHLVLEQIAPSSVFVIGALLDLGRTSRSKGLRNRGAAMRRELTYRVEKLLNTRHIGSSESKSKNKNEIKREWIEAD